LSTLPRAVPVCIAPLREGYSTDRPYSDTLRRRSL
jgi:hypothetical protein